MFNLGSFLLLLTILTGYVEYSIVRDDTAYRHHGGDLSNSATIEITEDVISQFDQQKTDVLRRYLASSPGWEIRKEQDKYYAIRKELINGEYEVSLNGYYSVALDDGRHGTRVILSLGSPYGFGRDYGNITKINLANDEPVEAKVILEGPHPRADTYLSYVMFMGESINLEVYEMAAHKERHFTEHVFKEVNAELKDVLNHLETVKTTGILPIPERYPVEFGTQLSFQVEDGSQPGIYKLKAWLNPTSEGEIYAKVFDLKTGQRLSEPPITKRSTRLVGWSADGKTFFPYDARITVYEGDWDHEYEARFELWHRSPTGEEQKLIEKTRTINGWER
jgi:hypothetical protein